MPLTTGEVRALAARAESRQELWRDIVRSVGARTVLEVGVYRGAFAAQLLDACPSIETYYMLDPWRHLDDWNKPANRSDDVFAAYYEEAMARTQPHEGRRVVLRGRTTEMIDEISDGSLDFAYVDGDHTLRGITVDLLRVYPKVRRGGWIGGDDFARSIWQHNPRFEPTLVFPYAVHFAEATASRIYGLGRRQFLIEKDPPNGFEFIDFTGSYSTLDLRMQLVGDQAPSPGGTARPRRGFAERLAKSFRRFKK